MNRFVTGILCLLLVLPSVSALAGDSKAKETAVPSRPKIALVLAGGGAKGAAHIGVLKALEELHIPIDYITGTSMGAYVGGLYASGMSAEEIESLIYSVDWNSGYRDRVSRSQRRVRDKEYEDRYQLKTDLGVGKGGVRSPKGVVQGQNMLRILRETSGNLSEFQSFDDLVIPYRAVATDIIELQQVVIDHGYLVDAMMASMSVPGALPPYELEGRWLVDGGVINNMPVDVARQLGADIVIAVDISTDYKSQEDFTSFLTVANQLTNYLVQRSAHAQASLLTSDDVLLNPEVGAMETTEFDKMPAAFDKGYEVVMANQSMLSKLALSTADYQNHINHKQSRRKQLTYGDEIRVDEIVLNNQTHYSDSLLKNRLNLAVGEVLSTEKIESSIQELYVLDRFELVTYQHRVQEGKNQLVINVKEKSWGPNYVNFRFFLEDDFHTDSQYALGISTNFTDLNAHGAELRLDVEIGTDKLFKAELFSPWFSGQKVFTTGFIEFSHNNSVVPLDGFEDTSLEATQDYLPIVYNEWVGEIAVGYQYTLWQEFQLGARYTDGEAEVSNLQSFGGMDYSRTGVFARYRLDTLDSFSLPRKGVYLDLEYLISHDNSTDVESLGIDEISDTTYEVSAEFIGAYSIERHTLVANLDYGVVYSKNSLQPLDPQTIGGFLNLSGIPRNSLIGQNKVFTSLVYRYRWFDNDFGLFTSPFYVGGSIEYGGVWSDPDIRFDSAPLYGAGSLFVGIDSPIGPIMFGYGRTEDNFDSIYLSIGTDF